MKINKNVIMDFNMDNKQEASFLTQFVGNDEMIVFPIFEFQLDDIEDSEKSFVLERKIVVTDKLLSWWHLPDGVSSKNVIWYAPRNIEELVTIIEVEYTCCIINKEDKIDNPLFILDINEHYMHEDEEVRAMIVYEKHKGQFEII